jgi:hypothetical protein
MQGAGFTAMMLIIYVIDFMLVSRTEILPFLTTQAPVYSHCQI